MPGISIHVVDVARGVVGTGMTVEVYAAAPQRTLLAAGDVAANGVLDHARLAQRFERGAYEAVFHVAAWYRGQGVAMPAVPFLDVITYRFGIDDPQQHYHLPFKCTPWGYSCFRGGQ